MWLQGEFSDKLTFKGHSTLEARDLAQQPVVIPSTTPKPTAVQGESYPRYYGKVQLVSW
jgi:hypothetical protein